MSRRPVCAHCGKAYGQRLCRTEAVYWTGDKEAIPPYRGNGIVVRESYHGATIEGDQHIAYLSIWDDESWWGGYNPFCTLRCALDYARRAYARSNQRRSA